MKERVDRDAAAGRLAEVALREGRIDVTELDVVPMSVAGWYLQPYFAARDGRGETDIGGFAWYLRSGALEVRRSPLRFWRDSRSLRPVDDAAAGRVVASEVGRVGWWWWQRCSLLRRTEPGGPPRRELDRVRYRPWRFPLNDGEWRELIGRGRDVVAAEEQIRERIASIREAILAKRAEGIVHWGTADWSFAPADGRTYDRAAYLQRAEALFARIVAVESLETVVDRVAVGDGTAEVEIMQTMVRRERPADRPADGPVTRVRLRYRERQTWVRAAADDWRVRRVEFVAPADRTELAE